MTSIAGTGVGKERAAALLLGLRGLLRDAERMLRRLAARQRRYRIGWVTAHTLRPEGRAERLGHLGGALDMRVSNNARWIVRHTSDISCEIYDPSRLYDVVVFFKAMDSRCQLEAQRVKAYGGRMIFDANVNYYEIQGDYDIPGTRPTEEQQRDAIAMSRLADAVVADSSFIAGIARRYNPNVVWIPDNVDLSLFPRTRRHSSVAPVRLVWSGVSAKSRQLLPLGEVLGRLRGVELTLVSDRDPDALSELVGRVPCRVERYANQSYAETLLACDVIVSPKRLCNAYELGHTEYKITLGMAAGLPAVASPQQSYVEAVNHRGGGVIADSQAEWLDALSRLVAEPSLRAELGARARRTVEERYALSVLAPAYCDVIRSLL